MMSKRGAALLLSAVLLLAYFGAHADARDMRGRDSEKHRARIASLKSKRAQLSALRGAEPTAAAEVYTANVMSGGKGDKAALDNKTETMEDQEDEEEQVQVLAVDKDKDGDDDGDDDDKKAAGDKPAPKAAPAPTKDAPAAATKPVEAPKADNKPAPAAPKAPEAPKQEAPKAAAPAQKPTEHKPADNKPTEHNKPAEQPAAKQPAAPLRNPADVSIFDVKKSNTPDGKVEVVLKPLVAPPVARAQPPATNSKATVPSTGKPDAKAPAAAAAPACKKTSLSVHDADLASPAGANSLSVTKLTATCGTANAPSLAGGCSLKCDHEEDLDLVTLVGDGPDGTSAANAAKPATCSFSTKAVLKGSCKALVKIMCCADTSSPVSFSSESYTVSSSSSSSNGERTLIPDSNPDMLRDIVLPDDILSTAFNPLFKLDRFEPADDIESKFISLSEPAEINPDIFEEQPLSVAGMLEQAAAALEAKRQAAQTMALHKMQKLHADLLANQARMAAANARYHEKTQAQLRQNLANIASLYQPLWNPTPMRVQAARQDPTVPLLHVLTPQYSAVATAVQPEDFEDSNESALEDDESSAGFVNATHNLLDAAADTAAAFSNSLGDLFERTWSKH